MPRNFSVLRGAVCAGAAAMWSLLSTTQTAVAAPVTLVCTAAGNAGAAAKRQWVYDVQAQTVDGHHVGDTIAINATAYNRYFLTDAAIGFSSSSGVRHTVSRVDGSYTTFDANGKANGRGQCVPAT